MFSFSVLEVFLRKNVTTTLKNEEKDIVYNSWTMKIRYMKDKVKRHLDLKQEISIHFLNVY